MNAPDVWFFIVPFTLAAALPGPAPGRAGGAKALIFFGAILPHAIDISVLSASDAWGVVATVWRWISRCRRAM